MADPVDLSCLNYSESETRKNYIDVMLKEQGWIIGNNCIIEDHLSGLPTPSGEGYTDYTLYDREHRALAVVEAKRTSLDPARGYVQAKEYADVLQEKDREHRRPVIYITNGVRIMMEDDEPLREVRGFYSQEDLITHFNLRRMKAPSLVSVQPDEDIAGRTYQIEAVKAVCNEYSSGRRKSLLIMATGSGKTRVAASIMDILLDYNWAKNILFLADRDKLVEQAHDCFFNNLTTKPTMADKDHPNPDLSSRILVTTYPTMSAMLNKLDDNGVRVFSPGHFQLVITDEAHRSIYNKYGNLLSYFDSRLLGLTATPRDEVDHDTYAMFDVLDKTPAYDYEFYDGVNDGYLINFRVHDIDLKLNREGVRYGDLPPDEQEKYRREFADENGEIPEIIPPRAFMNKVISTDSIRKVLDVLWRTGLRTDNKSRLGKTIIFAAGHEHAEAIRKEFYRMFPSEDKEYCVVIDYQTVDKNRTLMSKFEDENSNVRIAISVDMLDTGVDIPSILNLVFFKPVYTYVKFWQMIGRGTRPCKHIIDGEDKKEFYIFDACMNFDWFDQHPRGLEGEVNISVTESVFDLRVKLIKALQSGDYQTEEYIKFRNNLIDKVIDDIHNINVQNYDVGPDRFYIDKYREKAKFEMLTGDDVDELMEKVAPHVMVDQGSANHVRFDNLMLGTMFIALEGREPKMQFFDLKRKAYEIYTNCATLGQVQPHLPMLRDILDDGYLESCSILDFENIRKSLRRLMDLLEKGGKKYITSITDVIRGVHVIDYVPPIDQFSNYKKKARKLVEENRNSPAIRKLRCNIPLEQEDFDELKDIMWSKAGTEEEYRTFYEDMPLDMLVRSMTGLDKEVADELFSKYLINSNLSNEQLYFVKEVMKHFVNNGLVDKRKLSSKPFNSMGSISEIFENDNPLLQDIIGLIDRINRNAGYDGKSDYIHA